MDSKNTEDPTLDVLFLWHFHQPYYGTPGSREFFLPWVRLHAVKAYLDMAHLLQDHPEIRATFNFSGSLLRQLTEYVEDNKRDRWWRWSAMDPEQLPRSVRHHLIHNFFSIDVSHGIDPLPRYRELYDRRRRDGIDTCVDTWTGRDFLDLQVLFNLAWCGHSLRSRRPLVEQLRRKGCDFSLEERDELLSLHAAAIADVLPLYRTLADRGQIEVSVTPMYHPILPLVIDTESAARATPNRPRPTPYRAPEHAATQIEQALQIATDAFGHRPRGMWPAEGSVSPEALELFEAADLDWIATDEEVLEISHGDAWQRSTDLFRPWRHGQRGPRIFFRDHALSDKIGFVYADNPARESARDFVAELHQSRDNLNGRSGCISIILDGENPWEHYPNDGQLFLQELYRQLAASPDLCTTVFSDVDGPDLRDLDHLHSGSWIMANYQIWIGHEETNQAWEWIRRADEFIQQRAAEGDDLADLERAREHLLIALGSDWFWWYGDDFCSDQDDQFDALFRALISGAWSTIGHAAPPELNRPIHGGDAFSDRHEDFQHELPQRFISPEIDGRHGRFFDWHQAGQITIHGGHGAMYETLRPLSAIVYGFSPLTLYLQLQPGDDFTSDCALRIELSHGERRATLECAPGDDFPALDAPPGATLAFYDVAELSVPLHQLQASSGDRIEMVVSVMRDELQIKRFPSQGQFTLEIPVVDPSLEHWIV